MRALIALVALAAVMLAGGAAQPVGHAASGTIAGPYGEVIYGGTVSFNVTWGNLKGYQEPWIAVRCSQDGAYVWEAVHETDEPSFVLGEGSSEWHGGAATCEAFVEAYGYRGSNAITVDIISDVLTFEASGA